MKSICVGIAASLALPTAASSHHSFSMFDNSKEVQLSGTVTQFDWSNPHIWIRLLVNDPTTGDAKEWVIEGPSTNGMARRGWTKHSLKPADKADLIIYILKSGKLGGFVVRGSANGKPIGTGSVDST